MNRNQTILLVIAVITFPLILIFVPDNQPGSLKSLEGVTLSNLQGEKFKLSGIFTEKKTLFVFWSITCGTCIEEIPFIISLHEKLKDKLNIIGVHPPGFNLQKIQKFVRKYSRPIPYLLVIDEESTLTKTFNVSVLPKTVMIDNRGNVLYSHVGYEESMEKEIENAIMSKL